MRNENKFNYRFLNKANSVMKVLFDHQIFSSQRFGGVSKYFAEIINVMPKETRDISAWLSNNEYVKHYSLFKAIPFFPNVEFRGKGRIMSELGKIYSLYKIKQGQFDIFHQTNFDDYCIPALGNKPMVTTYHDVNFLTESNYNERMMNLQKKSLNRADKVIAISQNTKNDLLKYIDIKPEKIEVIHHGVSKIPLDPTHKSRVVDFPYILYVGMRHAFKNFKMFVHAFGKIAHRYPEVNIICTRSQFSTEELKMLKQLKIENRLKVILADEITLARLYRDALFFVFPSTYEGFGMPILEAMIYGCPTALANASCFPEIAEDAALYFDPNDIESIASVLEQYLNSEEVRKLYASKGLERVSAFSWEKCAQQHMNVYKSLL